MLIPQTLPTNSRTALHLTITLETLSVPPEPRGTSTTALNTVGTVSTLAQTTSLSASASKTSALPVLVHGVHNPVDTGVVADLLVRRIYQNNFVILHGGILVDPVRVEDAQVGEFASGLLLGDTLLITLSLDLPDTLVLGLTVNHTTMVGALTSSTANTATNDNVSLLGLVAKTMSLVGTGGAVDASDCGALTVFPGADTKEEAEGVTLLVTP